MDTWLGKVMWKMQRLIALCFWISWYSDRVYSNLEVEQDITKFLPWFVVTDVLDKHVCQCESCNSKFVGHLEEQIREDPAADIDAEREVARARCLVDPDGLIPTQEVGKAGKWELKAFQQAGLREHGMFAGWIY